MPLLTQFSCRYCRFYQGRRTDDDDRQIHRWSGVAGEKGRWKRSLAKKCLTSNKCALLSDRSSASNPSSLPLRHNNSRHLCMQAVG